jgi:poly-gamma-glutamate synthesis protein (capsule biosynthesis protein)
MEKTYKKIERGRVLVKESIELLIFGDLLPTKVNMSTFIAGDAKTLFGDILNIIGKSDYSAVNLECPLTECNGKIAKSGKNLRAPIKAIRAIEGAGFSLVSIANNHIRDYGDNGVIDTINTCANVGISTVGANGDNTSAKGVHYITVKNKKIGFLSLADNECCSANEKRAGANGFNYIDSFDDVSIAKENCDFLIILYHSGLEHYQFPSPMLQKRCRKMVDRGADIVITQHSHCIGSYEKYKSGKILYGQGNFLFAREKEDFNWDTGLIVKVNIFDEDFSWDFIPTRTRNGTVKLCTLEETEQILDELNNRSQNIESEEYLLEQWQRFVKKYESEYCGMMLGFPKFLWKVNKLFNNRIGRLIYSNKKAIVVENVIRCESHHEALMKCVGNIIND